MSRTEIYPWSTLQEVGDYFVVTDDFKPSAHYFMNATVAQRNKHYKDRAKYTCVKTTYGCIVMLVQKDDFLPPYDYEVVPGIFAVAKRFDHKAEQPLGNAPRGRELLMQEKIDMLPQQVKQANLPWWWENGKLLWNPAIPKRKEDVEAFINKTFKFGPNDPYPEFYDLGDDFRRREPVPSDDEEDFGEHPIFEEGDGE